MEDARISIANVLNFPVDTADAKWSSLHYYQTSKSSLAFAFDCGLIICGVKKEYRRNGVSEFIISMDQWRITERIQKLRLTQLN